MSVQRKTQQKNNLSFTLYVCQKMFEFKRQMKWQYYEWVPNSRVFTIHFYVCILLQLEQGVEDKNKKMREAEEAKREKDRLEEMRRKEQAKIMDVSNLTIVEIIVPILIVNNVIFSVSWSLPVY